MLENRVNAMLTAIPLHQTGYLHSGDKVLRKPEKPRTSQVRSWSSSKNHWALDIRESFKDC